MARLIGARKVPTTSDGGGVWTLNQQSGFRKDRIWPQLLPEPYWQSVSLLLHGNGANNSTTFTDSSVNALTITGYDNAKISTTQSKFGGSSIYLDGSGDYLSVPASNSLFGFGTGDFTIEFFWYPQAASGYSGVICGATTYHFIYLRRNESNGVLELYAGNGWEIANVGNLGTLTNDEWHHIAISRESTNLRIFIDGSLRDTINAGTKSILYDNSVIFIGNDIFNYKAKGYFDEVRITKGVARYTAAFTPPTAAFPDES
jgi:hypothetical protein